MVLDDASASSAPSEYLGDSVPVSDTDPYAETDDHASVSIDLSLMPRPPIGLSSPALTRIIQARLEQASKSVKRPLTQEEATALAYYASRAAVVAAGGPPIGLVVGCCRAFTTMTSYRFPFFKPDKTTFNPDQFLSLRGRAARIGWHCARFSAYGTVGIAFGSFLWSSYATTTTGIEEARDPRLRGFLESLVEQSRLAKGGTTNPPVSPRGSPRQRQRQNKRTMNGYEDDASPTVTGQEDVEAMAGFAADDDRSTSAVRPSRIEQLSQQAVSRRNETNSSSSFSSDDAGAQQHSGDFSVDDSMLYDNDGTPSRTASSSLSSSRSRRDESAWDRVRRRGNSPTSSSNTPARPWPSSSSTPSSSSSSSRSKGGSQNRDVWAERRQQAMAGASGSNGTDQVEDEFYR